MSIATMVHLLRERFYWGAQERAPEPDLVMESQAQTDAFALAGEQGGVLAFLYLYNALQISTLIQTGDQVLDLACGPANQLLYMARLNPTVRFTGVDASRSMLQLAQAAIARSQLGNVQLQPGDITHLDTIATASMDCVTCTMSLHHLPDRSALSATVQEIRRVLKPGGRVFLVDFGRFKLKSTQRFFADELGQSAQFTQDYFNSLRAAFSVAELQTAAKALGAGTQVHATALAPFMVVIRSDSRIPWQSSALQLAQTEFNQLSPAQKHNYRNIENWFKMGGHAPPCALA
jgi:ubiquinone/menaquinone biosynthesis C-methylase UbiE